MLRCLLTRYGEHTGCRVLRTNILASLLEIPNLHDQKAKKNCMSIRHINAYFDFDVVSELLMLQDAKKSCIIHNS